MMPSSPGHAMLQGTLTACGTLPCKAHSLDQGTCHTKHPRHLNYPMHKCLTDLPSISLCKPVSPLGPYPRVPCSKAVSPKAVPTPSFQNLFSLLIKDPLIAHLGFCHLCIRLFEQSGRDAYCQLKAKVLQ